MSKEIEVLRSDPEIKAVVDQKYMRKYQRDERQREIRDIETVLGNQEARKGLSNPGQLKHQNDQRVATLRMQTPPDLSDSQRDKISRLNRLALEDAKEGMVTQEDMRYKPAGTVDDNIRWNKAKKPSVLLWKNIQLLLNPDSDARELCNIERFRPTRGTRDGMLARGAAIEPIFTQSNAAKENWPLGVSGFTQEELQELEEKGHITKGGFTITKPKARALRPQKDGGKVYDCKCASCQQSGRIFSGPMAKAQYARHTKSVEKKKMEVQTGQVT